MAKDPTLGFYKVIYFCLFCSLVILTQSAPENALVTQLPGFAGTFPSKHYSGYVNIDQSHGKNLFYYFVESERKPSEDPLVLWLNGGPGCSSFDGFVYEHGPFNFEAAKTNGSLPQLHLNLYSWSKVSNIIYLDSPVGVGLSYSKNRSDYVTGDVQTAIDTHAFLLKEVKNECRGNFYHPLTDTCESKLKKVDENIKDLNIYDVLEPCYHYPQTPETTDIKIRLPSSFLKLGKTDRPLAVRKRMFGRAWPVRAPVRDGIVPTWPQLLNGQTVPCFNDEVATEWLNDAAVRKAIHAEEENVIGRWELCTDNILYTHEAGSMIKYHKNLTSRGYRALIFSGDHDMCVPFTGSEAWTRSVGYKILDEWRPWTSDGQIAGYLQGYENNLNFLTIKGAGHTVPEYKPKEALDFYSRFLAGKPI
ncbi:serine carboxypeptidase-like 20 isoform X4 [Durio zibethinus]|uniref:Serine carboxypeptidase-like 20 isoform X4 n=1 Tax=Durio zibethinus TaxID=66656 RepID=A0A6P6A238_DURZI|nr:serine carboxypeptidase-like 20 isoform X4 [Durio zibethinus]